MQFCFLLSVGRKNILRCMPYFVIAGALVLASGCATMFNKQRMDVKISSEPKGAKISFSGLDITCQAPCQETMALDKLPITVTAQLPAEEDGKVRQEQRTLYKGVAGSFWVNFACGPLYFICPFFFLTDWLTDNMWQMKPQAIHFDFEKAEIVDPNAIAEEQNKEPGDTQENDNAEELIEERIPETLPKEKPVERNTRKAAENLSSAQKEIIYGQFPEDAIKKIIAQYHGNISPSKLEQVQRRVEFRIWQAETNGTEADLDLIVQSDMIFNGVQGRRY